MDIILLRKSNTKKNEKFPENVLDTFMCTQRVSPFFSKKVGKSNFKKTFYSLLRIFGLLNWIFLSLVLEIAQYSKHAARFPNISLPFSVQLKLEAFMEYITSKFLYKKVYFVISQPGVKVNFQLIYCTF